MAESHSRAFLLGESVFTTLRVAEGRPCFASAHKDRLQRSAEWLWGAPAQVFEELWAEAMTAVPKGNGVWRLTLFQHGDRGQWRSHSPLHMDLHWKEQWPAAGALKLQTCATVSRDPAWPSFAKTGDYLQRIQAARALPLDHEPLFVVDGQLCELMFANVVFVDKQTLITPAPGPNVLAGVGLRRLRWLAAQHGFMCQERTVAATALPSTQAFAVNAVRGVIPVASIDGQSTSAHPMGQTFAQEFFKSDETH